MKNDILIRPARIEDLPILYEFEQGIVTAERPFDPTLKPDTIHYYDLQALIKSDQALVVIACDNDHIVASGYAKINQAEEYLKFDSYAYLGFMFVRPAYRGRGIIQMIMEDLSSWTKEQGLSEIRLEVYDDNEAALKAYERFGMKRHMVEMRREL